MSNSIFIIDNNLKHHYPGALFGILLVKGIDNTINSPELTTVKTEVEAGLRKKFANYSRKDLDQSLTIKPYTEYYKSFDKTYHVRLQLESILAGKSIPSISPLVTSMFIAEMKNQLLTAGHDLDKCNMPLTADLVKAGESYTLMNGKTQIVKQNDMCIKDDKGIISSIILGPDQWTKITPKTKNAIYTVYAPQGVEKDSILKHLKDIKKYILLTNPQARIEVLQVYELELKIK